eukprot:m.116853 g.116853  ORF g.116853 m.116853 type:complete len:752 (-) comp12864_c1_seq1:1407-3662(-)
MLTTCVTLSETFELAETSTSLPNNTLPSPGALSLSLSSSSSSLQLISPPSSSSLTSSSSSNPSSSNSSSFSSIVIMSQFPRSGGRATSAKLAGAGRKRAYFNRSQSSDADIMQGFQVTSAVVSTQQQQQQGIGMMNATSSSPSQGLKYLQQQQHIQQLLNRQQQAHQSQQQHQQFPVSSNTSRPRTASSSVYKSTTHNEMATGTEFVLSRSEEEKMAEPDRINLDNNSLQAIPVIKHEHQLRLLNLQNNAISRISNLEVLPNLIFLDLYNNHLESLNGIESVRNLRVLMCGKNKLKTIKGTACLSHLDVLDLHGNQLSDISELTFVTSLRVLNLADNDFVDISPLATLTSMVELNLRKNRVESLIPFVHCMPHLQRLFLSDNKLTSPQSVFGHGGIAELSFDGNDAVTASDLYRERTIFNLISLRLLDNKRVSSEERRMAGITIRRVEEKRKQAEEAARMKQQRESEVNRIRSCWEKYKSYSIQTSSLYDQILTESIQEVEGIVKEGRNLGFLWVTSDSIHCYGHLDSFFDSASIQSGHTSLTFEHVDFSTILDCINKIRKKTYSITTLSINGCNLTHLHQLACLSSLNITHLNIDTSQETICNTRLWERFVTARLQPHGLEYINGTKISLQLVKEAEKMFATCKQFCSKVPINHAVAMNTFPMPVPPEVLDSFKNDVQRTLQRSSSSSSLRKQQSHPSYSQSQLLRIIRDSERGMRERASDVLQRAREGVALEREVMKLFKKEKETIIMS